MKTRSSLWVVALALTTVACGSTTSPDGSTDTGNPDSASMADQSSPDVAPDTVVPDVVDPTDVPVPPDDVPVPPMDVPVPPIDVPMMDTPTPPIDVVSDRPSMPDVVPDVPSEACMRPGAIEMVSCGRCGTTERFCNAMRFWEYGACTNQGVCVAGTTAMLPCGMCGTRTARCNDRCQYEMAACTGEMGDCVPGSTRRTSAGCGAGESRLLRCSAMCALTEIAEPCRPNPPADITILLETAGSISPVYSTATGNLATMMSRLVTPLLAQPNTNVGVSYFADFDFSAGTDRPFQGGVEPITDPMAIEARLTMRPNFGGGDFAEATLEALAVLAGEPIHPRITMPLMCSAGRQAGGCWRAGAQKIVIVVTDSPVHLGPDPMTGADSMPYTSMITPAPARWSTLRPILRTREGISILYLWAGATMTADTSVLQLRRMATDMGQPDSDVVLVGRMWNMTTFDPVVARVRALRGI